VLHCTDLNYFYGSTQRLKDVSLRAQASSLIGLFGHNGAGKTTLLKMLGGSFPVMRGRVHLFDRPALDKRGFLQAALRSKVGALFQGTSSDEKLSAHHNLVYAARLMGVRKTEIQQLVTETLTWSELSHRACEPIKKFSHGMRRRLELYRAFMHKPSLVLLDEPTAGLDVGESAKFFSFLKNYQREHQALVIMSSHRPEEMMKCDRVLMMKDGQVITDQPPDMLLKDLNYLLVSISSDENASVAHPYFYDIKKGCSENLLRAKVQSCYLDEFLKSPLLTDCRVRAFSVERPTIADAYEDLL